MAKKYIRVGGGTGWKDSPSTNTPRNASNLNIMDKGIDDLDNAIVEQQAQIDALVVYGDSSPAVAQAIAGTGYITLKERLDTEHNEVTSELATKAEQVALVTEANNRQSQDSNLQGQIDTLVVGAGTSTAETVQTRTDTGGLIHNTSNGRTSFVEKGNMRLNPLSAIYNGYARQLVGQWEIGGIDGNTGNDSGVGAVNYVMRTPNYIDGGIRTKLIMSTGYTLTLIKYDDTHTRVSHQTYYDSAEVIKLDANYYYRATFRINNGTDPITDITGFMMNLFFVSEDDRINYVKEIETDIGSIKNDILEISSSNILNASDISSITASFRIDDNEILYATKPVGASQTHYPLFFKNGVTDVSFKHIRADDWIVIGGAYDSSFSAVAIGTWSVRFADLGSSVNVRDISITPPITVGEYVRIYWIENLLKIDRSSDRVAWTTFASIDMLVQVPAIINWKNRKIMGAVISATTETVMMQYVRYRSGNNTLRDDIDLSEKRITKLETNVYKTLDDKTWNPVGDSITAQAKYMVNVKNILKIPYINYGLASSTIAINNTYLQNKSIVERICGLNGNTAIPDADIWTVMGGLNDQHYDTPIGSMATYGSSFNLSTVYGALQKICEYILNLRSHPRLILLTPMQSVRDIESSSTHPTTMAMIRQSIIDVGKYYSIPVLDLWAMSGISQYNIQKSTNPTTSDGVHINDLGAEIASPYIAKIIADMFYTG